MLADGSMTEVGSGSMDFTSILGAARRAGIRHYFVEHDRPKDPMASVTDSYRALAELRI
jgi:sugar phosphate isomerase/epimerase